MSAFHVPALLTVIITLALPPGVHAQEMDINYTKVRDTLITRTCGSKSLDETLANQAALERIDPRKIHKGLDLFHYDAAMLAYTRFGLTGDTACLAEAIGAFHRAIDAKPSFYPAFQGLAICHYLRQDCPAAVKAVTDYKNFAPRKHRNDPQLDDLVKSCADRHPQ